MAKTVQEYKNNHGNLYINTEFFYTQHKGMHGVAKKFNNTQFVYFYHAILFYCLTGITDWVDDK